MSGARDWLKSLAAGQLPAGPAFIPLLEKLAPRVAGISYQQMSSDATAWSNALGQAAQLLGCNALTLGWDDTLLAEACGVPLEWLDDQPRLALRAEAFNPQARTAGRMPALLETAQRVCQTTKAEGACVLALTGPATLARQVFAAAADKPLLEQLKPVLVEVVEALCQGRPECLVFMESGAALAGDVTPDLRRIYNTLKNIATYYGVMPALYLDAYVGWQETAARWAALKLEHLLLGSDAAGDLPQPAALSGWQGLGWPLAAADLAASRARIAACAGMQAAAPALFFTTALRQPADIEALRGISDMLGSRS